MAHAEEDLPDFLEPYRGKLSPRFYKIRQDVLRFIAEVIRPNRDTYKSQLKRNTARARRRGLHALEAEEPEIMNVMREEAKKRGLWNFFLPEVSGLSVLEYAPIAELLGAFRLANVAMNCSAPDTGNMEVL